MVDADATQPLPPPSSLHTPGPERPARRRSLRRWLRTVAILAVLLPIAAIMGVVALVYAQARTDETRPVDAIVVMGAAQYNGRPSAVLEARLERALGLWEQGMAPRIVVTGGRAPGDAYTEAETGWQYLVDRGVPSDAILLENSGRSTWESARGVAEVLPPADARRVLVVSDGFHLFRSELMLREAGYETWSTSARDSPIRPWSAVEFSYVVRETGGVVAFLPELLG